MLCQQYSIQLSQLTLLYLACIFIQATPKLVRTDTNSSIENLPSSLRDSEVRFDEKKSCCKGP